uniref:Non-structural protein n=1 Tax=Tetraparvovirus ungulate4 TaxID=3052774 RepID=A0A5K7R9I5_9VIRU|nr:non-structural protein [Tetraparvovirus ungulate4]AZZ69384.1 non-structural protein [Tetraparvovirus ungulate4]AZZ69390.1 non-structural protein [Tetraparvovirus ungulate4]AZZ69396.1 non-structural protein [Tetraparvovirus ungulate4]
MDASCFTALLQIPTLFCESVPVQVESPAILLRSVADDYPDWPVADLQQYAAHFDLAVNLGHISYRELLESFAMLLPLYSTPKLFLQLEPSNSDGREFHYHSVCEQGDMSGSEFSTWLKRWRTFMDRYMAGGHVWTLLWNIRKTRQGRLYQADLSFVVRYLLPKLPVENCWFAWSNIERFQASLLSVPNRVRCLGEGGAIALPYLPSSSGSGDTEVTAVAPSMAGKSTDRFLCLIVRLVEQGIATERRSLTADKKSYRSFLGSSGGVLQAKNALMVARREMVLAHPLLGYLQRGGKTVEENNKVVELFKINGYDPEDAAWYFAAWAQGAWAKRRALWLWGPASTGKTLLAAAIAHLSPSYGCVNWTNQNFPFIDCHCQTLVWWEEGRMTENIVEVAKAILGGAPVRLDVKNKGSEDFIPRRVIITSNGDLTVTVDGPVISTAHQEALQTRITMFQLQRLVPVGLAPLPESDLHDFFKWGADLLKSKGVPPEAFRVPRRADTPRLIDVAKTPLSILASAAESRESWDSEDDWFPPSQSDSAPRSAGALAPPNSPATPNTPDPTISQLVSAPFPSSDSEDEEYQRYLEAREAVDLELWWARVLFDLDWAGRLNLVGPRGPRPVGFFHYHLWLQAPWRYHRRLALTEAAHRRRFRYWYNW